MLQLPEVTGAVAIADVDDRAERTTVASHS
jgi:hypothetical protein